MSGRLLPRGGRRLGGLGRRPAGERPVGDAGAQPGEGQGEDPHPVRGDERGACKEDKREKLREPPGAARRHLFVLIDGSSGTAFSAAGHGMTGRVPNLCEPITTVWVAGGGHRLFVATPPGGWEEHTIPEEVFAEPDGWLDHEP